METLIWIDCLGHVHTMHKIDATSKTDEVKTELEKLGWPHKYVRSIQEMEAFVEENRRCPVV